MKTKELLDLPGAFWRLLRIRLALRHQQIRDCEKRFDGYRADGDNTDGSLFDAMPRWHQRGKALKRCSRLVPGAHCLARALALRWWMRSQGLDARMVIGVRRGEQDEMLSHAWVEFNGHPVDETPAIVARHKRIRDSAQTTTGNPHDWSH